VSFRQRTPEQRREAARKGGLAKAAAQRARKVGPAPYGLPFLTFLDAIGRGGPSRAVWRVFWKAADGLPLDPAPITTGAGGEVVDELAIFRTHTGRLTPPTKPARECWLPAGRRGGKSENMTARATWRAISRNWRELLAPGEVGTIPLIAADRDQARNSLAYLKGLARHELVKPHVARVLKDSVEFRTGAVVKVATASWRSTRGFTMLDVLLEECAFYTVEGSANPDEELLTAIKPALLTVPGARVYGISSPYARRGILWKAYAQHWGQDGSDVLVFSAASTSLNPTLEAEAIRREFEADPTSAASEYGDPSSGLVAFRSDVERFLSEEALVAVTAPKRFEVPPLPGVVYYAFTDPSGGSQDSYTVAVAHREGDVAMLDCVRERRPPFSPEQVTREFAELVKSYRVRRVVGDRYAGEWPREQWRKHGVEYRPSELPKSDIYREVLAPINAGRVTLLDLKPMLAQFAALERRVARGGRDSIDHPPQGRDDLSNSAAGALVRALKGPGVSVTVPPVGLSGVSRWTGAAGSGDVGREKVSVYDGMRRGRKVSWYDQ
jgi:hypothetical protein